MSVLRFPNPGSDIPKFISTYVTIYKEINDKQNFTHDDARDAMIKNGLVSSSGAIGLEAVNRSVRDDRSLDPLYNQLKMYSELYRMLGWFRPGTMNTNFNFTELSSYLSSSAFPTQKRIFEECLLSIVFPNPLVENKKGNIIRPFPLVLKLAQALGGVIFRDEIIVTVLALANDQDTETFQNSVSFIKSLRGDAKRLQDAKTKLSNDVKIQENTLGNYTRFPLGSIKETGWFTSGTIRGIYGRAVQGYTLTKKGVEKAHLMDLLKDVRHEHIKDYDLEIRGAFTLLSHYNFLERCSFDIDDVSDVLVDLTKKCLPLFNDLHIENRQSIFYSPIQQSLQEEIDYANKLDIQYQK